MTAGSNLNVNNGGVPTMLNDTKIQNTDELEFVVFCIENIAIRLGKKGEDIYQALTEKSDILNNYIIPEYEMLHMRKIISPKNITG